MKILFLDTEFAPALGYFYGRFDQTIRPEQIVHNGFMLSYQAAWGDGKVFVGSLRDIKNITDKSDKRLLIELSNIIEQADIVIAHNGVRFDIARINARLAAHNLKPLCPPIVVDTLKEARKNFRFESNSLDGLGQELGVGRKFKSGGFETSIGCINGDKSSWNKLLKYGKQDVELLRDIYYRIRPWIGSHPNHGVVDNTGHVCPICGSVNVIKRGYRFTVVGKYTRYRCVDCGGWSCGRVSIFKNKDVLRGL